jgi:hypothetical protein
MMVPVCLIPGMSSPIGSAKQENLVQVLCQCPFEYGVDILGPGNDLLVDTLGRKDVAVEPPEQAHMQQGSESARELPDSKIVIAVLMIIGFQG